jgi:hypothetical protein
MFRKIDPSSSKLYSNRLRLMGNARLELKTCHIATVLGLIQMLSEFPYVPGRPDEESAALARAAECPDPLGVAIGRIAQRVHFEPFPFQKCRFDPHFWQFCRC